MNTINCTSIASSLPVPISTGSFQHNIVAISAKHLLRPYSSSSPPPIPSTPLDSNFTVLTFPEQTVYAGTSSLIHLPSHLTSTPSFKALKKYLLVTDQGLQKVGLVNPVVESLKKGGVSEVVVFDRVDPNPTVENSKDVAKAFVDNNCDACIGLGGGGPLDAMKGGVAVVARHRSDPQFRIERDGVSFLSNDLKPLLRNVPAKFVESVPPMVALPTTAGTGSEGGKSAVLTDPDGVKFVFGHPIFFPKIVVLAPQLTAKMPPRLTAATGIDALFHLLEAYFVTEKAAYADGLDAAGIARCDHFALDGTKLVVEWLPRAFSNGDDLTARFYMQVAALYGAKAFRKGDLGAIHATAHALGARYHLHHGASIARMSVPVLQFNQKHADNELTKKINTVQTIFTPFPAKTLADSVKQLLIDLNLERGLFGLEVPREDLQILANLAKADGCQTNPIPLTQDNYLQIFKNAAEM